MNDGVVVVALGGEEGEVEAGVGRVREVKLDGEGALWGEGDWNGDWNGLD